MVFKSLNDKTPFYNLSCTDGLSLKAKITYKNKKNFL